MSNKKQDRHRQFPLVKKFFYQLGVLLQSDGLLLVAFYIRL